MPKMIGRGLSRREREILEILHRIRNATANEIMDAMPEPPSHSAVRSILRIMEEKGHIQHIEEGKRYVYSPVEAPQTAAQSALRQVMQTFFAGSLEQVVKTFLSDSDGKVSEEELDRLSQIIDGAKKQESQQ